MEIKTKWMIRKDMIHENTYRDDIYYKKKKKKKRGCNIGSCPQVPVKLNNQNVKKKNGYLHCTFQCVKFEIWHLLDLFYVRSFIIAISIITIDVVCEMFPLYISWCCHQVKEDYYMLFVIFIWRELEFFVWFKKSSLWLGRCFFPYCFKGLHF